jgi:hypothetical protein
LYSSTRSVNYRLSKCLVKKRKVCTSAMSRYKEQHYVYTYTKKYVLRKNSVSVCKVCMVPVNILKTHQRMYKYTEKYTLRTIRKMYIVPGYRYRTGYCIYTGPNICTYRILPVNISKVKQFNPERYPSNLNVRVSTYTQTVHDSTEYSTYKGNNWLHAAPPHPPADSQ